jgi:hypothetical protein
MNILLVRSKNLISQTAGLETLAVTALLLAIGYGINAADPFYLHHQFPWLIVAPLLIALRYGFLFGMSSTFLFVVLLMVGKNSN